MVLSTVAFSACSDDDDNNGGGNDEPIQTPVYHYGEITIINKGSDLSGYIFTFNLGDTITIDYGDGYVQEAVADENRGIHLDYTYSGREERTITIKGNISEWSCYANQLTSLDFSNCTALTKLQCSSNQLTSLNVSGCTALTELSCSENRLTSLDVSNCTALTELDCGGNELTSLDVSKNTALTELSCSENQLTSLNITKNTALTELYCDGNQLTSLDVTKNTALTVLYCHGNQFTATEMNKIYEALPTVEYGHLFCDQLGNPGIAEQKGWQVTW